MSTTGSPQTSSAIVVHVEGHVQGVGFRAATLKEARRLNCSGYVCNLENGAVEVWVQGSQKAVEELLKWLAVGPRLAQVSQVRVVKNNLPPASNLSQFEIR